MALMDRACLSRPPLTLTSEILVSLVHATECERVTVMQHACLKFATSVCRSTSKSQSQVSMHMRFSSVHLHMHSQVKAGIVYWCYVKLMFDDLQRSVSSSCAARWSLSGIISHGEPSHRSGTDAGLTELP